MLLEVSCIVLAFPEWPLCPCMLYFCRRQRFKAAHYRAERHDTLLCQPCFFCFMLSYFWQLQEMHWLRCPSEDWLSLSYRVNVFTVRRGLCGSSGQMSQHAHISHGLSVICTVDKNCIRFVMQSISIDFYPRLPWSGAWQPSWPSTQLVNLVETQFMFCLLKHFYSRSTYMLFLELLGTTFQ